MSTIRWLHISDFHYGDPRRQQREQPWKDMPLPKVDLLFFAGDLRNINEPDFQPGVDMLQQVKSQLHLGKNDLPVSEARKIVGNSFIIGGTANTFEDIENLTEAGADYIGLGPFRFTETKKNLSPILGIDGYRSIMEKCRKKGITIPIVAIGGITAHDISSIMETGINGIALSGTILRSPNPVEETANILNIIKYNQI